MVFKRLFYYVKPYFIFFLLGLIFSIITVIGTLSIPIIIGDAIDLIIDYKQVDFVLLKPALLKLFMAILITALSQWLMNLSMNHIALCTVRRIRNDLFATLQQAPLKYIDRTSHGEIISRMITDTEMISEGLLMGLSQLFTGILTILGTLLFMLQLNIIITISVITITPISLIFSGLIAKHSFRNFEKQSSARATLTGFIDEMVGKQKIVNTFMREDIVQEHFETLNEQVRITGIKAIFTSSLVNPTTRFVNSLVYASVGVLGSFTAIRVLITIGQLSAFLSYANQYTKPFNEISGVIMELQSALASAKSVFLLIDTPQEEPDNQESLPFETATGTVSFDDVSFSYTSDVPLIENFNLNVTSGKRIAIVGPTGCGKTTLINLLMRFYDVTSGAICIDNTDIRTIPRSHLRSQFGMVLQETWLSHSSIADNIAYGKEHASREEIMEAAKLAHAHHFINLLEHGYDTILSEDASELSVGQKQLLCIARVMLILPPMLILDEATSSIDTRTEQYIQQAFRNMMKGRTSFVVAHRLSTIKESDCILVMNEGHIVEQGTHQELLDANGFYANLYHSA